MKDNQFDAVIVGGSYAGLAAAMSLGRAIRKVLIVDNGKPCNLQTPHSHNFLTQDGSTPAAIAELGKQQVMAYPTVQFKNGLVTGIKPEENGFLVTIGEQEVASAKKILFATGIRDLLPQIESFDDCWGISVIHCPYCHGYEYKGQKTGILANGDNAVEFSRLIHNWTDRLSIFTNGPALFTVAQLEQLSARNIQVIEKTIEKFQHVAGYLKTLKFADGSTQELDVMYARLGFEQHCTLPQKLGCLINETGYLEVDEMQKTSVPGIYAAGDNTNRMRSVASAVAAGTKAGALINHELIVEQ